jgi:hypothetical protein
MKIPSDVAVDATPDSPAATDAGQAGAGAMCQGSADCRPFSNYCGGCTCVAIGATAPDPSCDAGMASCFANPCQGHSVTCTAGHCQLL